MAIFETESGKRYEVKRVLKNKGGKIYIDGILIKDCEIVTKECKCVDICKKSVT